MDSNEDLNDAYNRGEDGGTDPDDYSLMSGQAKKSKRAKNNTRTNKFFYVKFVIAILIVETYYSYNYGMMRNYTDMTQM